MRKAAIVIALLLCFQATGIAQLPNDKLNAWGMQNAIEKLYLQFDRDNYLSGQTIWFKSYIISGFLPGEKSTTLYVELLTAASKIVVKKIFPVYTGFGKGQIDLPDTLQSGQYYIRAYSPTMLNHDPAFLFIKSFYVGGRQKARVTSNTAKNVRLDFFPEGGNFVEGLPNTLAFKATDENGYPADVRGIIKNNKGEIIKDFESIHDGMGQLDLIAESHTGLYAEIEGDATAKKYTLPEPAREGIVFRVLKGANGLHFEILQSGANPVFNAAYMVGQMQHKPVFTQTIQPGSSVHGLINTSGLLSGILHLIIFNKDHQPLAERLCFVNNKEFLQDGELIADTLSFSARGRNHFTLTLKDTLAGSFSVAVTDNNYNNTGDRSENIISRLLLTADLRGYIHNPAYYFSAAGLSDNAIDLVMMTHGWRRFKWEKLLSSPLPANQYQDPGYISLRGGIDVFGRSRPFADKELLLFIASGDSSRNIEMIKTDAQGKFRADSLVFFERTAILFSDIGEKKNKFEVKADLTDSLMHNFQLPPVDNREIVPYQRIEDNPTQNNKISTEYDAMMRADGIVLAPVIVKARKKTKLEEVEERYVNGIFMANSNKTLDFTNTNELASYRNIFDYLQSRLPGVQVVRNGLDYVLYYRQTRTLMGGLIPMQLFLDEMPADANLISFIPANQIALVKLYNNFAGSAGNAAGGVLAVYTKKGNDLYNSLAAAPEQITIKGYSMIKEFYAPDYTKDKESISADHRMTLYWNPDLYAEGGNVHIPIVFYNNDQCKSFKVVIEGMTIDGRLLMIEKTITGKAF